MRELAIWWDEVAWVAVDRHRWLVSQGPSPWEAVRRFISAAWSMATHHEVALDRGLEKLDPPPPDIAARFIDAVPLPPPSLWRPDRDTTYVVEIDLLDDLEPDNWVCRG